MANLEARLKKLIAVAHGLPRLPSSEECRGSRERLLKRLQVISERIPERRAQWDALRPEEQARVVGQLRERLVERLREMGLRP